MTPSHAEVAHVMRETGMDELQAINHLRILHAAAKQSRTELRRNLAFFD